VTWQTGPAEIDGMFAQGRGRTGGPKWQIAERFLAEADRHLASAEAIKANDPRGAISSPTTRRARRAPRCSRCRGCVRRARAVTSRSRTSCARSSVECSRSSPTLRRVRKQSEYPDVTRRRPAYVALQQLATAGPAVDAVRCPGRTLDVHNEEGRWQPRRGLAANASSFARRRRCGVWSSVRWRRRAAT
jgi:hypothetical protein